MTRYRTKPQTVEAVQWRGDNAAEVTAFFPDAVRYIWAADHVIVKTDTGGFVLFLNDWAVRRKSGATTLYTEDDFAAADLEKIEPREENVGSD